MLTSEQTKLGIRNEIVNIQTIKGIFQFRVGKDARSNKISVEGLSTYDQLLTSHPPSPLLSFKPTY